MLVLEITETELMDDPLYAMEVLGKLKALGAAASIDDFGTGYSSLAYLKNLPIDELKIDRSFVGMMVTDESDLTIVRSIIDLSHNLGLDVVAEGVEDADTLEQLSRDGLRPRPGLLPVATGAGRRAAGVDPRRGRPGRDGRRAPAGRRPPLASDLIRRRCGTMIRVVCPIATRRRFGVPTLPVTERQEGHMDHCHTHRHDEASGLCRSCHRRYCEQCLVYSYGRAGRRTACAAP